MKTKKLVKKLVLNKKTVADLVNQEMNAVNGGVTVWSNCYTKCNTMCAISCDTECPRVCQEPDTNYQGCYSNANCTNWNC